MIDCLKFRYYTNSWKSAKQEVSQHAPCQDADAIIVRQMFADPGVPVEAVVKGSLCFKFDE